jgi:hypothetical protein
MRCDEIRERLVDLLYDERGTPPASPELKAHVDSCPSCRKELEELRGLQGALRTWEDEPPLRPVRIPVTGKKLALPWFSPFRMLGFAVKAAVVIVAFLALANAEFTWNREGFSFKTHAFSRELPRSEYPTWAETLKIVKQGLHDSEAYMRDENAQQLNAALDLVDKQMGMEMRYLQSHYTLDRAKN